ncbi:MAG: DUF2142 domain-containing protein, partial [Chloroflexi bacterium]|nr:DUF2142 domain-containing protein [Chloroflexota bacterium]
MTYEVDIAVASVDSSSRQMCMAPAKGVLRLLLPVIVIIYCLLGFLYASETPPWQTPDEPAHFNYVKYLAEEGRLPVLQMSDFPLEYLEEIKAARFPPQLSISALRYESHQPPLYYALAAPLYLLTNSLALPQQLLALRLLSVALGAAALWLIHSLTQDLFPTDPFLPLAATAVVATIPMHLAISAAVNNDTLAELMLLLVLWQSLRGMRTGLSHGQAALTGLLLGLVLLTKTTIYVPAVAVIGLATAIQPQTAQAGRNSPAPDKLRYLLIVAAVAGLLAAPWFVRNALVYGDLDILGWRRHDLVASGQLRTSDLLTQIGWLHYLQQFALTTFRSFWAQFGWMGVLVDERIYRALVLLSGLLGTGLGIFTVRVLQRQIRLTSEQVRKLGVLGSSALCTLLVYVAYNGKFVQHQGRYL